MKRLKLLLCSTLMVVGVACSGTANTQKESNKETRQKANAAYNELEYGAQKNVTKNKSVFKGTDAKNLTSSENMVKPVIMVMPAPSGKSFSVQEVVASNPEARATMEGVMDYLTKKGYEVKSLEGSAELNNLIQMQNDIIGTEDDQSYLASLSLDADIYIKFSGFLNSDGQVFVELSAYESSTARQLGSHSSSVNSHGRTSPLDMKANLKTAASKAMSGLETKLVSYWLDDMKKGVQYKIIMNIKGDYSDSQLEDLQENVVNNLKASFNKVKVNTMTAQTIDLVAYADPEKVDDAQSVYSEIRKLLKSLAETKKISITKKLIIMDVK
ncbi:MULTISPECIES: hypothetical protein [unclassified Fibrobacter]|uniref:hypothetical protein n=1 Tax=unclassified Fibrobacter TaxID=2634177 RepID=UPI000DB106F2|nr:MULTISPECIES: hypothetical protein [unclassified Fibrobacter]PZW73717.1 hypothetical protein C8E88_100236 [Fibrobacter sp. UWR1]